MLRLRARWLVTLALVGVAAPASADLPPPNGQKYVGYAFKVQNTKAFSDWVLLAYPCSFTNGAPMIEAQLVAEEKPVSVGRRGGSPELYRMKRSDYEASKDVVHSGGPGGNAQKLEALFNSDKVVKCTGAKPAPLFVLASSDPRSGITETLRVESISAEGCKIAAVEETSNPPAPKAGAKTGCGGCAVTERNSEPAVLALVLIALGLLRRR